MKSLIALTWAVGSVGFLAVMGAGACSSKSGTPAPENPDTGTGPQDDSSADTGAPEDQDNGDAGSDGGGDTCGDASGVLPTDCASCLASKCSSDLAACACDSTCVAAVHCYNDCADDGGAGLNCAVSCTPMGMIGFDSGNASTSAILNCAITTCTNECEAPQDGGTGDASADGGADAGAH